MKLKKYGKRNKRFSEEKSLFCEWVSFHLTRLISLSRFISLCSDFTQAAAARMFPFHIGLLKYMTSPHVTHTLTTDAAIVSMICYLFSIVLWIHLLSNLKHFEMCNIRQFCENIQIRYICPFSLSLWSRKTSINYEQIVDSTKWISMVYHK